MARKTLKSHTKEVHKEPATWLTYAGGLVFALPDILREVWANFPPELKEVFPHTKSIAIVLLGTAVLRAIYKFGGDKDGSDK